ncbi:MAG: hypothetical protein WC070_00225 [Candidatus Magasanikbacteria bacterium]
MQETISTKKIFFLSIPLFFLIIVLSTLLIFSSNKNKTPNQITQETNTNENNKNEIIEKWKQELDKIPTECLEENFEKTKKKYVEDTHLSYFNQDIKKPEQLLPTDDWKEFSNDILTIKYPPNYIVNEPYYRETEGFNWTEEEKSNIITITEKPDDYILAGEAYTPGANAGIIIYPITKLYCPLYANSECKSISGKDYTKELYFFLTTNWQQELISPVDGNSPIEAGTNYAKIDNKFAIQYWFKNASGIEGPIHSANNLYINYTGKYSYANCNEILPIKGFSHNNYTYELKIIDTMYSTIKFK